MKCDICDQKIKLCDGCHDDFTIGDLLYCYDNEHYCSEGCLMDNLNIDEGEVIK